MTTCVADVKTLVATAQAAALQQKAAATGQLLNAAE